MSKKDPEDFRKILEEIARKKSDLLSVFRDFCRMVACSLAAGSREEEYQAVAQAYSRKELERIAHALGCLISEMESKPFRDILGIHYMEVGSRSVMESRGEFYTPHEISSLLARITINPEKVIAEGKPITVNDPTSGSGGIILALAEEFSPDHVDLLRVTCQDISPLACDMCYINMTLWGIPARIVLGDALWLTVENSWCNVHWFRVGENEREKWKKIFQLVSKTDNEEKLPSHELGDCAISSSRDTSQLSFDFEIS